MDILWIGMAFIFGMLVSRIKLPPLVGYLAAGGILSVYGYEAGAALHEVAHLGVLLLLFTVGLHLRLKNIVRIEVLGTGGIHLLFSVAIFVPIAWAFGYDLLASLIIAVVLGFSSTVLTAKNLERRGELGAFHGRVAIGILILQDIVAIVLLGLTSGTTPSPWSLALLGLPLIRPGIIKIVELSNEEELKLLFALMLAMGGGAIFEGLGLSSELGALVAGMLLSGHAVADELSKKLWGLKEAFLVGFFLEVGLAGLPSLQDFYLALIAIAILPIKAVLFYALMLTFKLRARTSFIATVSLTSYSEFTLIAGSVAASAGFIPEGVVIAFALLTAVSFALNAPLSIWEERLWERMEMFLSRFERDVRHPDQQTISLGSAEYLVVGMGNAGQAAYDRLKKEEKHVVGMDIDPARIEQNLSEGRRVIYGDMQDIELWNNLDLSNVKSVIMAIGTPEAKVNATKYMRTNKYKGAIYALTMREDEHRALGEAGASAVCLPITQAGRKLAELSLSDNNAPEDMILSPELNS
ncbi:cation:proton antiporter [Aliifodinibius sp. S!AR15-10]|uniref:cation:proton antiporter domain-containing protein n=1 Tax=Aliifodinibius sp. S!AR15-10 TaxID=2950437 RepID=UPI0028589A7A|nr:cation:proton antiporter [Aliifodinibius sp. S!AR15-10]MDR8391531.1 cation:proton antiporter [Aliifodinibius sp. S!AR15-10]